jgi:DNA-binding transcriptional ArsR family regulator
MNDDQLSNLSDLFVALSDKTRLKLLGLIGGDEVAVGYLAESIGESQPKVSRHLAYLRNAGLVSTRRDGKWIYYGIELPDEPAQRHVLLETLRMLGTAVASDDAASFPVENAFPDEVNENDYVPQEIEIFLL